MILILRRLLAVLILLPLGMGEVIWTLLKIISIPFFYIILGPSDKPCHGIVEISPAEPNFERVVRWCRIIAGDKKA